MTIPAPAHTPGPWEMGQNNCYETALVAQDGTVVASAAWSGGSGCHLAIQNEADARLIAAAPALVAALEFIANVARTTPGFSSMALKEADMALSLALGEQ